MQGYFCMCNVCVYLCRHGAHPATAAAAGLPHGSSHAAKHAGNDGNEFWGTNASWSYAHAGEDVQTYCSVDIFSFFLTFGDNIVPFSPGIPAGAVTTVSAAHEDARLCFYFSCFCVTEWDAYWDADPRHGFFGSAAVYGHETCWTAVHC